MVKRKHTPRDTVPSAAEKQLGIRTPKPRAAKGGTKADPPPKSTQRSERSEKKSASNRRRRVKFAFKADPLPPPSSSSESSSSESSEATTEPTSHPPVPDLNDGLLFSDSDGEDADAEDADGDAEEEDAEEEEEAEEGEEGYTGPKEEDHRLYDRFAVYVTTLMLLRWHCQKISPFLIIRLMS